MGQLGTDQKVRDFAAHNGGWVNVRQEIIEGSTKEVWRANLEHVEPKGLSRLAGWGLKPEGARGDLWDLLVMLGFAGE